MTTTRLPIAIAIRISTATAVMRISATAARVVVALTLLRVLSMSTIAAASFITGPGNLFAGRGSQTTAIVLAFTALLLLAGLGIC